MIPGVVVNIFLNCTKTISSKGKHFIKYSYTEKKEWSDGDGEKKFFISEYSNCYPTGNIFNIDLMDENECEINQDPYDQF